MGTGGFEPPTPRFLIPKIATSEIFSLVLSQAELPTHLTLAQMEFIKRDYLKISHFVGRELIYSNLSKVFNHKIYKPLLRLNHYAKKI
jgi:hypothetical protein